MKHLFWTLVVAASLAAPLPAAGQHAVPRGGGGSDSGGGSSSSGGSSSGGSSSGGGSTSSSGSSGGGSTWAPPRHPGGSSSSGRSGGSSGTASARSRGGSGSSAGSGSDRVVPETGGRTRDGRPITGYAVPRGGVVPDGRPGGDFYYYPRGRNWYHVPYYYSPYYTFGYGFGYWGLAYIWDPFWWGPGFDPWFGGGAGYGFGTIGIGGGGSASEDYEEPTEGTGALRIKVKPREARVMVDGTFAGTVDDFDGNFQKLRLDAGSHAIELQAEGFEPLKFDILIVEDQTITYKGKLRER